jgi:hypothetical protein
MRYLRRLRLSVEKVGLTRLRATTGLQVVRPSGAESEPKA